MKPTTFMSVCSGIEAASEAWCPLGWVPVAYSEIDPAPCYVLHARHGSGRPWFMPEPDEVQQFADGPGIDFVARKERQLAIASVAELPVASFNRDFAGPPPNFGDMTRFEEWPDVPAFDVLCGGTPCQSFSVAGLRGGLDDARGNLMLTFAAIARRYRPGRLVWENVPGVLSSNGGRDFASLLGILSGRAITVPVDGWKNSGVVPGIARGYGLAWRVFDAQFFGVAQRRRRVFVVGYLGDWRRAAAVLLECAGLRGDPAPRRQAKENAPAGAAGGARGGGPGLADDDGAGRGGAGGVARTLTSSTGGASAKEQQYTFVREDGVPLNALDAEPTFWDGEQVTSTLDASVGTKRQTMPDKDRFMAALVPAVADPITANEGSTYTHEGRGNFRTHNVVGHVVDPVIAFTAKDHGQDAAEELSPTLRSGVHSGSHANGGVMPAVAFKASHFTRGKDGAPSEVFPPLTADADKGDQDPVVLAPAEPFAFEARVARNGRGAPEHLVPPLKAQSGETGKGDAAPLVASAVMRVRRLMPSECELLQGFPSTRTRVTVGLCFDPLQNRVNVALQSHSGPLGVWPAVAAASRLDARTATACSITFPGAQGLHAAVSAHLLCGVRDPEPLNHGRSPACASNAAASDGAHLPMRTSAIALDGALAWLSLGLGTRSGAEAHQARASCSIALPSGDRPALLCGDGSTDAASGAVDAATSGTFTTSALGCCTPTFGSPLEISLCSVLAVIAGCIQRPTLPGSFSLVIDLIVPHTLVAYRGKTMSDGPRYKTLGNSWAVPCAAWIGRRMDMLQELLNAS